MYQNCCKKCGSTSLFTKQSGNNTGLYCSGCGAWIKWLGKDELNTFENAEKKEPIQEIYMSDSYRKLDERKVEALETIANLLSEIVANGLPINEQ